MGVVDVATMIPNMQQKSTTMGMITGTVNLNTQKRSTIMGTIMGTITVKLKRRKKEVAEIAAVVDVATMIPNMQQKSTTIKITNMATTIRRNLVVVTRST